MAKKTNDNIEAAETPDVKPIKRDVESYKITLQEAVAKYIGQDAYSPDVLNDWLYRMVEKAVSLRPVLQQAIANRDAELLEAHGLTHIGMESSNDSDMLYVSLTNQLKAIDMAVAQWINLFGYSSGNALNYLMAFAEKFPEYEIYPGVEIEKNISINIHSVITAAVSMLLTRWHEREYHKFRTGVVSDAEIAVNNSKYSGYMEKPHIPDYDGQEYSTQSKG
jgi:hypothetical protein